jgi:hypothetical protein
LVPEFDTIFSLTEPSKAEERLCLT